MTVHTVTSLHIRRRRIDRRLKRADVVLREMERGSALFLQHTPRGSLWTLSKTGQSVHDSVARVVIASGSVTSCDTGLFDNCLGQVWRWWRAEEENGGQAHRNSGGP
jgi:hypothetical protein